MSTERYVPMCMRMVCVHYYLDGISHDKVSEDILAAFYLITKGYLVVFQGPVDTGDCYFWTSKGI